MNHLFITGLIQELPTDEILDNRRVIRFTLRSKNADARLPAYTHLACYWEPPPDKEWVIPLLEPRALVYVDGPIHQLKIDDHKRGTRFYTGLAIDVLIVLNSDEAYQDMKSRAQQLNRTYRKK